MAVPNVTQTEKVDNFMKELDHPFKHVVQEIRESIKSVDPQIKEEIKWAAPSFSYKDYICTFNLRETKKIHLVFHNPEIGKIKSDLLEGDYKDRRMVYFVDKKDFEEKKREFERVTEELVQIMDKSTQRSII